MAHMGFHVSLGECTSLGLSSLTGAEHSMLLSHTMSCRSYVGVILGLGFRV